MNISFGNYHLCLSSPRSTRNQPVSVFGYKGLVAKTHLVGA